MFWVAWRLHRRDLRAAALLLGAAAVTVVVVSPNVNHLPGGSPFVFVVVIPLIAVVLMPGIVGATVAAPGIARELRSTWTLAWTQSLGRDHWFRAHTAVVLVASVAVGTALSVVTTATFLLTQPHPCCLWPEYDYIWIGPIGLAVLGAALGVMCAATIRKPRPAMLTTVVVFLVLRAAMPLFATQVLMRPLAVPGQVVGQNFQIYNRGPILESHAIDINGRPLPQFMGMENLSTSDWPPAPGMPAGISFRYLPERTYPIYQVVELAVCLLLAGALIGAARLVVRRWPS